MTKKEFDKELSENRIVVAKFGAEWCGPCRSLQPVFEEVARENADARMISIDVEESDEIVGEYGVTNIPLVLYFLEGEPFSIGVGAIGKDNLSETIQNMRNTQKRNG